MSEPFQLFGVSYRFEAVAGGDLVKFERQYSIIEQTKDGARKKADTYFKNSSEYQHFRPSEEEINCNVYLIRKHKIKFPELTLSEDKEHFNLVAKVSEDGQSLEFIVSEKE